MATKKNWKAFTLRIPSELNEQIESRRKIHHRSKNDEIHYMLEKFIEDSVKRDLSLASKS